MYCTWKSNCIMNECIWTIQVRWEFPFIMLPQDLSEWFPSTGSMNTVWLLGIMLIRQCEISAMQIIANSFDELIGSFD